MKAFCKYCGGREVVASCSTKRSSTLHVAFRKMEMNGRRHQRDVYMPVARRACLRQGSEPATPFVKMFQPSSYGNVSGG